MDELLLEIKDLHTFFYQKKGIVKAVNGVSLNVCKGEILGVVGESGCGKSVTALSVMRLIPQPPGKILQGSILLEGQDLLKKSKNEIRQVRGNDVSMIFQEPMTSLNPVYTVGYQIAEAIQLHLGEDKSTAWQLAIEQLRRVGIPEPGQRVSEYPHQLSGGMRQRVMIAMALACNPRLLIADEPTTALDVTIQYQILELINKLRDEVGMSVILITHDLGVTAQICDRVAVMYAGKVVEYASVRPLFKEPRHPYTAGLMSSIPKIVGEKEALIPIKGLVPDPSNLPGGCSFHPRCPFTEEKCRTSEPELTEMENGRSVRCWRYA